jgi:hypothetical protein
MLLQFRISGKLFNCKTLYSMRQNLDALFLIKVLKNKISVVPLWMLFVSVYPLNRWETSSPLTGLALQQGAPQPETSADLQTFPFPLHHPIELHHYRVPVPFY